MSEEKVEYFPPSKPWREREGKLALVGMRCSHCGTAAFPKREVCSACGRDDGIVEVELPERGQLYSFSEVHVAPKGFATPYVIGYVDMDGDVRVLGQIDGRAADLKIGQTVAAYVGPIRTRPDGSMVLSYRFREVKA